MLAMSLAGTEPGDLSARVGQAAIAAQSFQGPLDGTWVLRARSGGILITLRFVDIPGRLLQGAWSRDGNRSEVGAVDTIRVRPGRIEIQLACAPGAAPLYVALVRGQGGVWHGRMVGQGVGVRVTLRRAAS